MASKSIDFVEERKTSWERLRLIVQKTRRFGSGRLTPEEARDFPNLYRKTCTDIQTAKTLRLSPDMIDYINSLIQQAHTILYGRPQFTIDRLIHFFTRGYPRAFAKNLLPIAIIFMLFFGIGIISFATVYSRPETATEILSEQEIDFIKEMWMDTPVRSGPQNIKMAGYYISNNVTIGFASFTVGIAFGFLTLLIVFFNAISIGASLGLITTSGYGDNLFSFVIAHSAFELLGLVIAAGAGLAVGIAAIRAVEGKRSAAVAAKAREVVPLFIIAGLYITIAAFIEGFVSASTIPLPVKITIACISLILIVTYSFSFFFRRNNRKLTTPHKQKLLRGAGKRRSKQ